MISKINGIIDDIGDSYFTIMTSGGVGYNVYSTINIISNLKMGEEITIFIETQVREDSIRLFGFTTLIDKIWFNLLCTVQGVGAKVAISILSSLTHNQLYDAISMEDKTLIATANGVGPKMASRIISELQNKIDSMPKIYQRQNSINVTNKDTEQNISKYSTIKIDAVTALVNFGYKKSDAINAVSTVISEKLKSDKDYQIDISELIKSALKTFETK